MRIALLALSLAAAVVSGFLRPAGRAAPRRVSPLLASVEIVGDLGGIKSKIGNGNDNVNGNVTTQATPLPMEELYSRFYRLVENDGEGEEKEAEGTLPSLFDAEAACRDHGQLLFRLIGSDVQNLDAEENATQMQQMDEDVKPFPESYVQALDFTRRVLRRLQCSHHLADLYSAAKFIPKKEGLLAIRTDPASLSSMTVRSIVESKRKIERSLSLLLMLLIAHTQAQAQAKARAHGSAVASDLVLFSKILLERLPVHERHFAMLVLCRGILVPPPLPTPLSPASSTISGDGSLFSASPYPSTSASSSSGNRAARRLRAAVSQPPLGAAFASSMRAAGVAQPSATARMIFPFAASALRSYHHSHRLDRDEEEEEEEEDYEDEDEKNEPSATPHSRADLRIARLAAAFAQIDYQSRQANGVTGAAEETLVTLRRWLLDLCAGHFIAMHQTPDAAAVPAGSSSSSSSTGTGTGTSALPEHLRRNTVVMELIHTNQALAFGRTKHRLAWETAWEEVGAHMDALCSLFDEPTAAGAGAEEESEENGEDGEGREDVGGASQALTRVKKYLSCVSLLRNLPAGSKTRQQLELSSRSSSGGGQRRVATRGRGDDDLFGDVKAATSKRGEATASDAADADLWSDPKVSRSTSSRPREAKGGPAELHPFLHSLQPRVLLASADRSLATLVAEALSLPALAIVGSPAASSELHYVFSSWRRPGLLLDYLHIHASSPQVQALHRRFLRALFSLSRETVDDIRFQDPGNRLHMSRLPPALATAWMDGRSPQGVNLPGYNDPQTLFMVGEDSSTCMMIRPRQKGTNRGLQSFLLHGNVRVLGRKDSAGRLLERCVVVLVIDDTTQRPVLLVETPFGEGERMEEVYDQCAELGDLLGLPVVYSKAPEADVYVMGDMEIEAVGGKRGYVEGRGKGERHETRRGGEASDGDVLFEDFGGDGGEEWGGDDGPSLALEAASPVPPERLVDLFDYTRLAPWVWIDGVWDPARPGRFFPGRCPTLTQRASSPGVGIGVRPVGTIEDIPYAGPLCGEHAPADAPSPADALFHSTLQRLSARGSQTPSTAFSEKATSSGGSGGGSAGSGKRRKPREANANSMTAKLAERNRLLAARTMRPLRPPVPEGEEKTKPAEVEDRFAGEKEPAFMPIFADDADDLFG